MEELCFVNEVTDENEFEVRRKGFVWPKNMETNTLAGFKEFAWSKLPVIKLLLSFAKIINLIQYLLGGTVFYYSTALGTCKRTSRFIVLKH